MGVGVEGLLGACMPEVTANGNDRHALVNEVGCAAVTQVVDADALNRCAEKGAEQPFYQKQKVPDWVRKGYGYSGKYLRKLLGTVLWNSIISSLRRIPHPRYANPIPLRGKGFGTTFLLKAKGTRLGAFCFWRRERDSNP